MRSSIGLPPRMPPSSSLTYRSARRAPRTMKLPALASPGTDSGVSTPIRTVSSAAQVAAPAPSPSASRPASEPARCFLVEFMENLLRVGRSRRTADAGRCRARKFGVQADEPSHQRGRVHSARGGCIESSGTDGDAYRQEKSRLSSKNSSVESSRSVASLAGTLSFGATRGSLSRWYAVSRHLRRDSRVISRYGSRRTFRV